MNQNESLISVIALLYKWKKHILGATFLAAALTAMVSLTMPNFYESHTSFYAANPDLASPMPVDGNAEKQYVFGNENDLDRLFSISKSAAILDHLTEKFDLYKHYDIDPNQKLAKHKLSLKFNKLYKTKKTKYDAVDLSVEDIDPELASDMANEARMKIDDLAQKLIKESQSKLLTSYKNAIAIKEKEYKLLVDSLNSSRTIYNIFSSEAQGEAYGSNLVEVEGSFLKANGMLSYLKQSAAPPDSIAKVAAKRNGLEKQLKKLKADVANYNVGFPIVKNLERLTRDYSAQLYKDKVRLSALQATYDSKITAMHIVEKASVPVYKSRPKRSVLVLGAAFLTFILTSIWVLLRDQYKQTDWKQALDNV